MDIFVQNPQLAIETSDGTLYWYDIDIESFIKNYKYLKRNDNITRIYLLNAINDDIQRTSTFYSWSGITSLPYLKDTELSDRCYLLQRDHIQSMQLYER